MLKVASLFSGGGGLDLGILGGFHSSGHYFSPNNYKIVFANDNDNDAINTYKSNPQYLDHTHLAQGDIRDIKIEDIPEFDVLFAGFPCQPFSNAGNRKGVNDDNGRGTLWEECERIIKHAINDFSQKPKAFIFENVRGITSSKTDEGKSVPEEIKNRMEALGYNVSMQLLRSSEYGVPQNRFRYIIAGIRKDLKPFDFNELHKIIIEEQLPSLHTDPYNLLLGSVLCDLTDDIPQKNEFWKYSPQGQNMVNMIGSCLDGAEALDFFKIKTPLDEISDTISTGRSWKNISPEDLPPRFKKIHDNPKKYHSPNFYRRFALGEIAGTITASAQPENCGITHPFENRRFSIREAARIQSFPDDFIFPYKSIQNAYKVIGNAVPPILGWVIAKSLQEQLSR